MWKKLIFGLNFVCLVVILSPTVYAYIDPSAVTYTAQAIAAVVVALGAILTVFRHKIKAFFKNKKEDGKAEKREIRVVDDDPADTVDTTKKEPVTEEKLQ